ncbi:histidine kinase [Anaeromyxobacter dehalogenans 2CP-C]|uniref:histidine kinase n=1 Tax=Anaeromyxobacter dehalogenans (strain 2CP-C) TaxID=290397 RepID=Q2II45_ANADE|nr:histidine kinase [Anaeromyxobacter dehalogenans 2CP-C]
MHTYLSAGAAFVDPAGTVIAADPGFLAGLGLEGGDPTGALRARAEGSPALRALLAGEGPPVARLEGADGEGTVELERIPASAGALLLVRPADGQEWLEHAARSDGLTRIAAGVAHDIKNPLNAMSLQLALLAEKLAASPEASGAAASHLGALRDQVVRVNEVLRRLVDVADPSAPLGYTDVGALLADAAALLGHDARRRRVALAVDAHPGAVRSGADAARLGRLLLGTLARAVATTPEGGRLAVRAATEGEWAVVRLEQRPGDPGPESGYYSGVAAAAAEALGGSLEVIREGGEQRSVLRLPRNDRS